MEPRGRLTGRQSISCQPLCVSRVFGSYFKFRQKGAERLPGKQFSTGTDLARCLCLHKNSLQHCWMVVGAISCRDKVRCLWLRSIIAAFSSLFTTVHHLPSLNHPPASLSQQSVEAFFSWGWILIRLPSSLRFFGNMCTKNSLGNQKYSSISRYCCAMHLKCKTKTSDEISQHWTQDSKSVGRLVDYNNPAVSWHFCQIHSFAPWCGLNICKANKLHALNHKDTFRGDPAWHHSFCMSLQCQVVFHLNVTCTSTFLIT